MPFKVTCRLIPVISLTTIAFVVGCRQEVPKAVENSTSGASNAKIGAVEPAVSHISEIPFELVSGFVLLKRDDFESFQAETETWNSTEEGIICTGKPKGYLYSKRSYDNFILRLDYRFPRPVTLKDDAKFKGNTGFLVYITGDHKLWPVCLEVQGKHIQMAAIKENGGADPVAVEDNESARQEARKSPGQWNSLEVISLDGAIEVLLNGTKVSRSKAGVLNSGPIGIQAEDHPFEIRRMRIKSN